VTLSGLVRNAALGREVNYKSLFKAVLGEIERTQQQFVQRSSIVYGRDNNHNLKSCNFKFLPKTHLLCRSTFVRLLVILNVKLKTVIISGDTVSHPGIAAVWDVTSCSLVVHHSCIRYGYRHLRFILL
jgi:hypothetical protein